MIINFKTIKIMALPGLILGGLFVSCQSDPNSPGMEYMPDMYRSPSIEAYVDYANVKDKTVDSLMKKTPSLLPPNGTVPYSTNSINDMPYQHGAPMAADMTHGLYGVEMDGLGYKNSANDINPIAYTESVKSDGKELYGNFCIHCHGEKGEGQGPVVTNSNGAYPPPPAYNKQLKDLAEGQIFYSITYGKGLMGAHGSQLNKEERWKLVHYIQILQGKTKEFEQALLYDSHTDTDGDGVMDNIDECPENAGSALNHGCPEVASDINQILTSAAKNLTFNTGSAVISESSYIGLDKVVAILTANANSKLIINGHTDNIGNANLNKGLSLKRASAVRTYLVDKGIDVTRLMPIGYGQVKPVSDNSTEEGRLVNRRVEFRLL